MCSIGFPRLSDFHECGTSQQPLGQVKYGEHKDGGEVHFLKQLRASPWRRSRPEASFPKPGCSVYLFRLAITLDFARMLICSCRLSTLAG